MKLRTCKHCGSKRPPFTFDKKTGRCDKCRVEKARAEHINETVAEDIKAKGRKLLAKSDYRINKYTLEEPNEAKLKQWKRWRKKVRNKIRTCKDGDTMVFPKAPNERN